MKKTIKKFLVTHNIPGKTQRHKFESNGFYYYNGLRATFTEALSFVEQPGIALDIGAGFGNEVKVLLKRGFDVVATDSNPEAVKYLERIAKKNTKLQVMRQALPKFPHGKLFDLIVCEMVLHFLSQQQAYASIEKVQANTRVGGINVISSYIEQPEIHNDPRIKPGYFSFLLPPGELKQLYSGWEILYYQEKSNKLNIQSARLIARRISTQ
jgi:2-polyprenyl-3-methyl-5-hydroxy-6-metoxy-1,4-benzoquinol methylase